MGDFIPEGLCGSGGRLAQQGLELGEEVFDGIEVRRIGWQKEKSGTGAVDSLFYLGNLVACQVVEDDDFTGHKRRHQHLFDVGEEYVAVHGLLDDHRGGESAAAQRAYEGSDLPVAVRSRTQATLPAGSAAVAARHIGRCPGFIDEYELFCVHRGQSFDPCQARLDHVLAFLLAGVQGFF